ncbi:unnamed protein product [Chironomus riparius]|uniref:Uncharacterized protein n=1 Tax=Chironomus riparius TaxID=315576 RepID=A0A9N9WRC0_9DIPT|nr:unnamed protein product [Chironomus riparius]
MKFVIALIAFAAISAVKSESAPVQISGNNIGDVVTVGVNLNAVVSSNAEVNILTALIEALKQQAVIGNVDIPEGIAPIENKEEFSVIDKLPEGLPDLKNINVKELIQKIKDFKITPELIEKLKALMKKE